ncbi:MAG: carbohydrate ABC transporter permease [Devosia sp.]|jgi:raffinose/stachyose/melibiose transport system permease protein|nr:carbohydrate ABC transporter permease [Alphaproteobacteria bacterium]MBU1562948.1 carbohydrate ABC transporter permease [Alphaproteobacteria bacterium]MBU2303072.1 carbohydrate ABC transporter permease [Alphaproteobacteria bacterium]MBU2368525.1 carbohydrate ABC transporter permease [Alphaproteobacteria bacterium]
MSLVRKYGLSVLAILVSAVVFLIPFAFIIMMAFKDRTQAQLLDFSWPQGFHLWTNIVEVVTTRNWMLLTAFINSSILTVASVTLLVIFAAMVGFVLQRRKTRFNGLIEFFILAGLMIPPAVVPTIWLLQGIGLFGKLHGLILVEVAYGLPFSILLYRAFIATIPRELDEAAIIDGARPFDVFFRVILPLLWPVTVTNIVVQSVAIFNDFTNPLYYLPGNANATVQLTLYNFQSQFNTSYNLLFTNIALITIPPLVVFLFFNRQIVAGMTAGAVKG